MSSNTSEKIGPLGGVSVWKGALWWCCCLFCLLVHISGQIIATSHDLTPNDGLVRETTVYFRGLPRLVKYYSNLARYISCYIYWWDWATVAIIIFPKGLSEFHHGLQRLMKHAPTSGRQELPSAPRFCLLYWLTDLGVSKNKGTPKSSILIGFSFINHPFWGTPILGNPIWGGSNNANLWVFCW